MDTSETYIKMSEKMKRHSPAWKPQEGDWFCCRGEVYIYQDLYMGSERNEDCFPLYRQDQLQEMVIGNTENREKLGSLLSRFWVFCSCKYLGQLTFEVFVSMEQLWLAFVMKEKYNKTSNGKEWRE